jgi:hypothetical protein
MPPHLASRLDGRTEGDQFRNLVAFTVSGGGEQLLVKPVHLKPDKE